MKTLTDHYFLFVVLTTIVHFCVHGLNVVFRFSNNPILKPFLKDDTKLGVASNLFIVLVLSLMFGLIWPIYLTTLLGCFLICSVIR